MIAIPATRPVDAVMAFDSCGWWSIFCRGEEHVYTLAAQASVDAEVRTTLAAISPWRDGFEEKVVRAVRKLEAAGLLRVLSLTSESVHLRLLPIPADARGAYLRHRLLKRQITPNVLEALDRYTWTVRELVHCWKRVTLRFPSMSTRRTWFRSMVLVGARELSQFSSITPQTPAGAAPAPTERTA